MAEMRDDSFIVVVIVTITIVRDSFFSKTESFGFCVGYRFHCSLFFKLQNLCERRKI